MTNPMVQEALFREHQQAMQRVEHDARLLREARLAPQQAPSQPAQCSQQVRMPRPAIDVRR